MPSIRIRDGMGQTYQIDSANPATVAAWLVEIIGRLVSANTTFNHPVYVDAWPAFVWDEEKGTQIPDWPPGAYNAFKWDVEQMTKLLDLLKGIPDSSQPKSEQFRKEYSG